MPKFFFHFSDGERRADDEWGLDLAGPEQAYLEAVSAAREMWPDLLAAHADPMRCSFDIEDERGGHLFHVGFSELLDGRRGLAADPSPENVAVIRDVREARGLAMTARSGLRSALDEVRLSLEESNALLERVSAFERTLPRMR